MGQTSVRQLVVVPQAELHKDRHHEKISLFNEDGSVASFSSGGQSLTPGLIYAADLSSGATTSESGTFDLSDYLADMGGWYDPDEENLLLPIGSYQLSITSNGLMGGPVDSDWAVVVNIMGEPIVFKSTVQNGTFKLGCKQVIYLTEESFLDVSWSRVGTTLATAACSFMLQAL